VAISHDFSRIAGLATLADGRWLVVDSRDAAVYLVDPARDQRSQLGRTGEGPNEYLRPSGVTRWLGDTVLVFDPNRRQVLKIDPAGRLAGAVTIDLRTMQGGIAPPRGADSQGRLYWDRPVIAQEAGFGLKRQQQAQVVRWDPRQNALDTVALIADHAPEMHANRFHPFAERDAWVVTTQGRVGVLVAHDYHLRWVVDRRTVADGPRLSYDPVPITAEDRDAFRDERARAPAGMAAAGGGGANRGPSPEARRRMAAAYPDESFPRYRPPFEEWGAWLSPEGDVWVARSRSRTESFQAIDILEPGGSRRRQLRLPEGRRIVALERSGIFLARVNDDGLEFLERYAWPAGLR
jgi:hypothetical protein